jgi:hypothetical protein
MADTGTINSAIESFENWQQPWTFFPSVVAYPMCGDDDRRAIEGI